MWIFQRECYKHLNTSNAVFLHDLDIIIYEFNDLDIINV